MAILLSNQKAEIPVKLIMFIINYLFQPTLILKRYKQGLEEIF